MEERLGVKIKRTAEDVVSRVGEAAQQASERLSEMREIQRLTQQIRSLEREKADCKRSMVDLMIRMFDQHTFAEALLRPEYQRIKEIDAEIAKLDKERQVVGQAAGTPYTGEPEEDVIVPPVEPETSKPVPEYLPEHPLEE